MFSHSRLICAVFLTGSGLLFAQAPPRADFGQVHVNGTSTQTLSISFPGQAPLSFAMKFGVQFSAAAPSCDPSGATCSLAVTFAPKNPGQQLDAVRIENASGQLVGTYFVAGVGVGPQITAVNGLIAGIQRAGNFTQSIAVDPLGNLYLTTFSGGILRVNRADGSVISIGSNNSPFYANFLALDSAGNIYFTDIIGHIDEIDGVSGVLRTVVSTGRFTILVLAIDSSGNFFVADVGYSQILRIDAASHSITTIAGNGTAGFSGDNGPASAAQVNAPSGIAVDAQGNIFISDSGNSRIRKIDTAGVITTVAGNGTAGFSGDGGPAITAELNDPSGLRVDAGGSLIVADTNNKRIRRITPDGVINTIAGNGNTSLSSPQGGSPALSTSLNTPSDVALDSAGHVFIADYSPLELTGDLGPVSFGATSVGSGSAPVTIQFYNSGNAAASIHTADFAGASSSDFSQTNTCGASLNPEALCSVQITFAPTSDDSGTATFNFGDAAENTFQSIALLGTTAVTHGVQDFGQAPVNSSSPPSTTLSVQLPSNTSSATFSLQYGVDFTLGTVNCPSATPNNCTVQVNFDPKYVGLRKDALIAKDAFGNVVYSSVLHGIGLGPRPGFAPGSYSNLNSPVAAGVVVAIDPASNLYVRQNGSPGTTPTTILKYDVSAGTAKIIAGGGAGTPEGIPATSAQIFQPADFVLDSRGDLLFLQCLAPFNPPCVVSRVDSATGIISTIAGGTDGYAGDGGPATRAALSPSALAVDANDNLYIADAEHSVIRKVSAASGTITTIAGTGIAGFGGDGGPALNAQLSAPSSIALDTGENIYILDTINQNIREISAATGIITTVVGTGASGVFAAPLTDTEEIAIDAGDGLILGGSSSILRIDAQRAVSTALVSDFSSFVEGLFFDPSGNLYVSSGYYSSELSLSGQPFNYGPVAPGQSVSQTLSLYNSGNRPLPVGGFSFLGSNPGSFTQTNTCPLSLDAGEACSVTVAFNPANSNPSTATIALTTDSSDTVYTNLAGNGYQQIAFSFNDLSYSFPATVVGGVSTHDFTVSDASLYNAATVTSVSVTGANASDFTAFNNCDGDLIPANGSVSASTCTISVVFSPGASGPRSATLSVLSGATLQTVPLVGTGISTVLGSASAISFPDQEILTPGAPQTLTLTNSTRSTEPVSLSITGANATDFTAVTNCSASFAPTATCEVFVVLTPSQAGARAATLTIVTPSNTLSIPLSGTGIFGLTASPSTPARFEIVNALTGKVLDLASASGGNGTAVEQNNLNGSVQQQWTLIRAAGPAGAYEIVNVASGAALDVTGESTALGALLQQYQNLGTPNQQWQLVPVDDVHYKIVNVNSGYVLDVPGGTTNNGTQIQQYAYVGTPQQMWVLVPVGSYNITNIFSSKLLDLAGGAAANGTAVQQNTMNGGRPQQWQFIPAGGGYFAIINRATGKVLDVTAESTAPGARIQEYDYTGRFNQQWQLQTVGGTFTAGQPLASGSITFQIVNRLSGEVLDDTANSAADGNPIQQYTYYGTSNQQWQIAPVQYYTIVNVSSGDALDVPGGSTTDKTLLQQYAPNGFAQQEWQFVPAAQSSGTSQYAIINNLTGKALDVSGASISPGALIDQSAYTAASNQLWETPPAASGSSYYQIRNVNSGEVLDVKLMSTANGAQIQQFTYFGTGNQQWQLIPVTY